MQKPNRPRTDTRLRFELSTQTITQTQGDRRLRAKFPVGRPLGCIDVVETMASTRGRKPSEAGGDDEWWQLEVASEVIDTASYEQLGVYEFAYLDNADPVPAKSQHISWRFDSDHILEAVGSISPGEEERLTYYGHDDELAYLRSRLDDAAALGVGAGFLPTGPWFVRGQIRSSGLRVFEARNPCSYRRPPDWFPSWV